MRLIRLGTKGRFLRLRAFKHKRRNSSRFSQVNPYVLESALGLEFGWDLGVGRFKVDSRVVPCALLGSEHLV
jgi:hypothetical protein